MINFSDNELLEYLNDDIPYLDLTTYLQNINDKKAKLEIFTREDIIVSCSEEASRIAILQNCKVEYFIPSKQKLKAGDKILAFSGDYNTVHKIWRTVQLLLEYSCKIATYTNNMKKKIEKVNSSCELLTTRKTYPFSKKFCIKSILVGQAFPHRLNLSETILFFAHHRIVYKNDEEFYKELKIFKQKAPEKKIVVEVTTFEDAKAVLEAKADVLQLDKLDIETIKRIVDYKNENFADVKLLATGGINLNNVEEYAKTQVDAIVTSSVYSCGMANLGSKISLI